MLAVAPRVSMAPPAYPDWFPTKPLSFTMSCGGVDPDVDIPTPIAPPASWLLFPVKYELRTVTSVSVAAMPPP